MSDFDDLSLDGLLQHHLSTELDPQFGRAESAFLQHVANVRSDAGAIAPSRRLISDARLPDRRRFGHRFNGWFIGLAGAAMAASIAALWAGPAAFRGRMPLVPIQTVRPGGVDQISPAIASAADSAGKHPVDLADANEPSTLSDTPAIHWVQQRSWDEGTVVLDDPSEPFPARKLRRQQVEHLRWVDPAAHARVEMTVPREDVKFVGMDTY